MSVRSLPYWLQVLRLSETLQLLPFSGESSMLGAMEKLLAAALRYCIDC